MNNKFSADSVYLIYAGASSFLFSLFFTVSQIYRIEVAALDPLQLVLVGTVLESATFLFEIPTGIVADFYSRKLSIMIGLVLIGTGFMLEGFIPIYLVIIVSQLIWGVGYTFISGANEAWIADEVGEKSFENLLLRGAQLGQILFLAGIITSTALGAVFINLPMVLAGALFFVLALFLFLFMPEMGFKPIAKEERDSWRTMGQTLLTGIKWIKNSTILQLMLFITLLHGLYSEGIDRLWNKHFIDNLGFPSFITLKPVVWFGIITASASVLSIIAVEIIKRKTEESGRLEKVWLLVVINGLLVAAIFVFALAGNILLGFMTYLALYILRTINSPLYSAWLNQNIKSKFRATILSTYGQIDALGQIVGGPIIGYVAYKVSIPAAIITAGMILMPVIIIYLVAIKKSTGKS